MENGILIASVALALIGIICVIITVLNINKSKYEIEKSVLEAEKERDNILAQAKIDAQDAVKNLRKELEKEQSVAMKQLRQKENEVDKRFSLVDRKHETINQKEKEISEFENSIKHKEKKVEDQQKELTKIIDHEKRELTKISGLTPEVAKDLYIQRMKDELDNESKMEISKKINAIKEDADNMAKEIIAESMQRLAHEVTTESTTSQIELPKEEMKGKIIGKEGRNIRAFEEVTGVDVIIDDHPKQIVVSAFDSYRREIAKRAMDKLILDGRIHPSRIEEVVKETEKLVDEETKKVGEQKILEAGFTDIHPELIKTFGRLKFRQSYGQNQISHSIQVMDLCDYIAMELNLDRKLAKRCGLLHDIGKAIDQGEKGTHPAMGYELAKKFGENDIVLNAIAAHHEGVQVESIYTVVTAVADAISAARPGARRESTEKYFERMENLESIANSYKGVSKAFAMRAGRELRISVDASTVNDNDGVMLSRDIAKRIEKELTYPGEVKVTLVRETRFIEYAR
jgi:ribonucrease Y